MSKKDQNRFQTLFNSNVYTVHLHPIYGTICYEYMVKLLYPLHRIGFFDCLLKTEKGLYKMDDLLDSFIQ